MDKEQFEQETRKKRRDNIDDLVLDVLKKMLECDVRMFDTHYIRDRVIQIANETVKKLDFKSEEIERMRRAFLDVLIDGMQENMFTIEDEIKKAKKELKQATNVVSYDKEKKRKAKEKLKSLERVRDGNPKDVTEERDVECEPVCQFIAKSILSRDWLLKDEDYTGKAIELDNELLILINAMAYINELFEQLYNSIDESYLKANEKHWGVPRNKIKMRQLDNRLK